MDVTWYLESTLALLVRSLGGHVEGSDMRKVAYRILCGLASDYVDGIVLKAADYWDIEYERRERNGQGVVTVLDSLKGADN